MGGGATKLVRKADDSRAISSKAPKVILEERITQGREKDVVDILDKLPELTNAALDDADGMRALQVRASQCDGSKPDPVQIACRAGHADIVQALVAKGAILDQKNNTGATALMYAAAGGFDNICKMLLDAGADVRVEDKNAKTALQYAQLHSRQKVEALLHIYACA